MLNYSDFNLGSTAFKLAFLCSELPSQLIAKRLGPDIWIPTQIVIWSMTGSAQFYLKGRTSFVLSRALLGMLQGGFVPEVAKIHSSHRTHINVYAGDPLSLVLL
jgi:hypothetical protein